jgi:hypothetical protein
VRVHGTLLHVHARKRTRQNPCAHLHRCQHIIDMATKRLAPSGLAFKKGDTKEGTRWVFVWGRGGAGWGGWVVVEVRVCGGV